MADCITDIAQNLISDCTTQGKGGNEVKVWFTQRKNLGYTQDVTNPSKITGLTISVGEQMWTFTGVKKLFNSGHDLISAPNRADTYSHVVGFEAFEHDSASIETVDAMDDMVFITESKDKPTDGDGTFRIWGMKNGLFKTSDTERANDVNGARVIEMASDAEGGEAFSQWTLLITDYATTLAALVALEAVQI
jgi:hypothetical protein